jgi:hypothetical protein
MRCAIISIALILIAGCGGPERMTYDQWCQRAKFSDANEADATALFQSKIKESEARVKTLERWDKLKFFGVLGIVGSIFALGLGGPFIKSIAGLSIAACATAIGLAYANTECPQVFIYIGGSIGLIAGLMAMWIIISDFRKAIKTSEMAKGGLLPNVKEKLFGDNGPVAKMQGKATTARIKTIRETLTKE